MKTTAEIARAYRVHCLALPKGVPGTIGVQFDYAKVFDLIHLRLYIAHHHTGESGWYSTGERPEFIRVAARVLSWYRQHGWVKSVMRGSSSYLWQESAP